MGKLSKEEIHKLIVGDPKKGVAGLQDDWWTGVAPDLEKSRGSYLVDVSGEEYLDLNGFFGTAPVRFDHPRLRSQEFKEELWRAGFYRPSLSDFWTEEMALFVKVFREVAVPNYMHHLFFIEGGALAVENALKAAFDWKVRRNMAKGVLKCDPVEERRPLGTRVISFENAFHGRSGYTLSLTHTADPRKYKYFPKFDWFRVQPPYLKFDSKGNAQVVGDIDKALKDIEDILDCYADDVAAIIIEPIQAEGGDLHIPAEFFKGLRELADKYEVLLIYDEVQAGMGTTGRFWAHQHFGPDAVPDLVSFGKKSQVCGVMANGPKMAQVKEHVFGNEHESKSRLNSTWGGNPVDMVRSRVYLEIIRDENLVENAAKMGELFLQGLRNLAEMLPDKIENPRGKGLMLAVDAKTPELQGKIWQALMEERVLSLTCGKLGVRFRPHLDITEDEVKDALDRFTRALKRV